MVWTGPVDARLGVPVWSGAEWAYHQNRLAAVVEWGRHTGSLRDYIWVCDDHFPPLLDWVMGLIGTIGGHSERAVGRAMVIWLLLLAGAVGLVARSLSGSSTAGWMAAGATVLTPALAAVSTLYYFDLPMAALLWMSVAAIMVLRPRSAVAAGAAGGLLWFLACITKWSALPLGALLLPAAFLTGLHRGDRSTRRDAAVGIGACVVVVVVMLSLWFDATTRSWTNMHFMSLSQPDGWGTVGEGLSIGPLTIWMPSLHRLAAYPAILAGQVLSPILTVATLTLAGAWAWKDRRGSGFLAMAGAGQICFLILTVPPVSGRLLLSVTPALVLMAVLGLRSVAARLRMPLAGAWALVGLLVILDVTHGEPGPLDREITWRSAEVERVGIFARGLSIASGELTTAWVRADDINYDWEERGGSFDEREALWASLTACDAAVLLVGADPRGDPTPSTFFNFRNHLASLRGERMFDDVTGWPDQGDAPTADSSTIALLGSKVEAPGWRALELPQLEPWHVLVSDRVSCPHPR